MSDEKIKTICGRDWGPDHDDLSDILIIDEKIKTICGRDWGPDHDDLSDILIIDPLISASLVWGPD